MKTFQCTFLKDGEEQHLNRVADVDVTDIDMVASLTDRFATRHGIEPVSTRWRAQCLATVTFDDASVLNIRIGHP